MSQRPKSKCPSSRRGSKSNVVCRPVKSARNFTCPSPPGTLSKICVMGWSTTHFSPSRPLVTLRVRSRRRCATRGGSANIGIPSLVVTGVFDGIQAGSGRSGGCSIAVQINKSWESFETPTSGPSLSQSSETICSRWRCSAGVESMARSRSFRSKNNLSRRPSGRYSLRRTCPRRNSIKSSGSMFGATLIRGTACAFALPALGTGAVAGIV